MSFWGIVVAAGAGTRFGSPKQLAEINGRPLWEWGRDALAGAGADGVVLVGDVPGGVHGGERRRDSVKAGLAQVPLEIPFVLVHDAARPLADSELVRRVARRIAVGDVDGVVPVVPIRDTLKRVDDERIVETLDRSRIVVAQTPQGFAADVLRRAHAESDDDASDDAVLVERAGGRVATVPGEERNMKVTYPEDLALLADISVVRAGFGVDAHAFGGPGPLVLSGVVVARERGVEATSDGDVVAHAVADAVLGAAALGDLGELYPSSDPSSQGADSMAMLRSVVDRIAKDGLSVANVDVTVIAQSVRVAPHRAAMRTALAGVLDIEIGAVSVKATTTDGLGSVGDDEGIACYAVVVLE